MALWVGQTRDRPCGRTDSETDSVVPRKILVHPWQEGNGQEFPLYPTTLNLEKAPWPLSHRCPCDITAVPSSATLPAFAGTEAMKQHPGGDVNT